MRLNKKGDMTTEEIVKTVLAIIVIVFLAILFIALVKIVSSNLKNEQAKTTLDSLSYEINSMPAGTEKSFLVESPKGYVIWADGKSLCVCPMEYLAELKQGDVENKKLYNLCSAASLCKNGVNGSIDVNLYNQDEEGVFQSVRCDTPGIVDSITGTKSLPQCIDISLVPIAITLSKSADGSLVGMKPVLAANTQNRMDIFKEIIKQYATLLPGSSKTINFDFQKISTKYSLLDKIDEPFSMTRHDGLFLMSFVTNAGNRLCLCDASTYYMGTNSYDGIAEYCIAKGFCELTTQRVALAGSKKSLGRDDRVYLQITKDNTGLTISRLADGNFSISLLPVSS